VAGAEAGAPVGRVAAHAGSLLQLERDNAHARDARIKFHEASHVYTLFPTAADAAAGVGGRKASISVTGFLGELFPGFEAKETAERMRRAKAFPFEERRRAYWDLPLFEGGRSLEELRGEGRADADLVAMRTPPSESVATILAHWEAHGAEMAGLGTALHADCERHYNGLAVHNTSREFGYFLAYAAQVAAEGWVPFRSEALVFDEAADLAGSVDMQFAKRADMELPPDKRPSPLPIRLCDWKRSKDIRLEGYGNQRGLREASPLPCCNGAKYCLQLATYAALLERHYGVTVVVREFVIFHPDKSGFELYDVDATSARMLEGTHLTVDDIVGAALARRTAAHALECAALAPTPTPPRQN
jgi:hypothetical protein